MLRKETNWQDTLTPCLLRALLGLAILAPLHPAPAGAEPPTAITQVEDPRSLTGKAVQLPGNSVSTRGQGEAPAWGTTTSSIRQIHAAQFVPHESSTTYSMLGPTGMRYRAGGTSPWFLASLSLPTGVKVQSLEVFACDENATGDIQLTIVEYTWTGHTEYFASVTTDTPGCSYFSLNLPPAGLTVNNFNSSYLIGVGLHATDLSLRFREVNVYHQLQVSPPPPTATFTDVPLTHPFFRHVEALRASGITSGCGGGRFCPDDPVTRGQMASFLARALGLHWPY